MLTQLAHGRRRFQPRQSDPRLSFCRDYSDVGSEAWKLPRATPAGAPLGVT